MKDEQKAALDAILRQHIDIDQLSELKRRQLDDANDLLIFRQSYAYALTSAWNHASQALQGYLTGAKVAHYSESRSLLEPGQEPQTDFAFSRLCLGEKNRPMTRLGAIELYADGAARRITVRTALRGDQFRDVPGLEGQDAITTDAIYHAFQKLLADALAQT